MRIFLVALCLLLSINLYGKTFPAGSKFLCEGQVNNVQITENWNFMIGKYHLKFAWMEVFGTYSEKNGKLALQEEKIIGHGYTKKSDLKDVRPFKVINKTTVEMTAKTPKGKKYKLTCKKY